MLRGLNFSWLTLRNSLSVMTQYCWQRNEKYTPDRLRNSEAVAAPRRRCFSSPRKLSVHPRSVSSRRSFRLFFLRRWALGTGRLDAMGSQIGACFGDGLVCIPEEFGTRQVLSQPLVLVWRHSSHPESWTFWFGKFIRPGRHLD